MSQERTRTPRARNQGLHATDAEGFGVAVVMYCNYYHVQACYYGGIKSGRKNRKGTNATSVGLCAVGSSCLMSQRYLRHRLKIYTFLFYCAKHSFAYPISMAVKMHGKERNKLPRGLGSGPRVKPSRLIMPLVGSSVERPV
jgi:hypothetical protein